MKKRMFAAMLAAMLLLGVLAGCSTAQPAAADGDLLAQIQQRGELIIAMEGVWAPWTYHDENDQLVGYDVEVGQMIADKLGVKATFVEGDWTTLLAGVESGRYDMVINGVEVDDERKAKYSFTDPYCYIRTALIVRDDNDTIHTFEDLAGRTTANSIDSTYMTLAEQYGATVSGVDSLDQTLEMVLSGRVDATLNADVSFYDYMNVHPEAALKVAALTDDASLVAIPVRKEAATESLVKAVNQALAELREEGKLSEAAIKYFGSDISQDPQSN